MVARHADYVRDLKVEALREVVRARNAGDADAGSKICARSKGGASTRPRSTRCGRRR